MHGEFGTEQRMAGRRFAQKTKRAFRKKPPIENCVRTLANTQFIPFHLAQIIGK